MVGRTEIGVLQSVRRPLLSAQESVHATNLVHAAKDTVLYVELTVGRTAIHVLHSVRRPVLSA